MRAYERLLKYVRVWTTSEEESQTSPTTERQFDLARMLVQEMREIGIKDADIRQYIYSMEKLSRDENSITLKMCIAAGNNYNLKPETVIDAMVKYYDGFKPEFFLVHREKIMAGNKELF